MPQIDDPAYPPDLAIRDVSPGLGFILYARRYAASTPGRARTRWRDAMRTATEVAIRGGMRFRPPDFTTLAEQYDLHRWHAPEYLYTVAVTERNPSAAQSLEHLLERPALVVARRRRAVDTGYTPAHTRTVDTVLTWRDTVYTITAITGTHVLLKAANGAHQRLTHEEARECCL